MEEPRTKTKFVYGQISKFNRKRAMKLKTTFFRAKTNFLMAANQRGAVGYLP
jgi:hypothetical protein